MPKTRTTLTIDEGILAAIKVKAARLGRGESELIEEAVRASLGWDVLEDVWSRSDLSADEATDLALEGQRAARTSDR